MNPVFRINFYTGRETRNRAARRRALRAGGLAALFGINLLLVATLILSTHLMGNRVVTLREDASRLDATSKPTVAATERLELARELHRVIMARTDWAPKLAALSETIDPSLLLVEIRGRARHKKSPASLELNGVTADHKANLDDVSRFIAALRSDDRFRDGFEGINLGTIRSEAGEFQVICEPVQK
jgi:Tfp pilus assembly protein PilN